MELQIRVGLEAPTFQLDYETPLMLIGSCFVENIGAKLEYFRFKTDINPCGIVYNPSSVAETLKLLLGDTYFTEADLRYHQGRWVSFSHHGRFSDPDVSVCLQRINSRLAESRIHLKKSKILVLTWGTAWVFRHRGSGRIVSNCHKFPAADFERYRLTVEEIVSEYEQLFTQIGTAFPGLKILFTVSPIRHWKDGAHGNQLSKAVLHLAIDRLMNLFDRVSYFPSYEIVMDELRDYRFYAEDMLHINQQGIDYIWEKFGDLYIGEETREMMKKIDRLNKCLLHRPLSEDDAMDILRKEQAMAELKRLGFE